MFALCVNPPVLVVLHIDLYLGAVFLQTRPQLKVHLYRDAGPVYVTSQPPSATDSFSSHLNKGSVVIKRQNEIIMLTSAVFLIIFCPCLFLTNAPHTSVYLLGLLI